MSLLPVDIGPLNPPVPELAVAAVLFALVLLFCAWLTPRVRRVRAERAAAPHGVEARAEAVRREAETERARVAAPLAEARHDAARVRLRALEEGAAPVAEVRAEARREYATIVTRGQTRIATDRARAEAELRVQVSELASNLASRILGEQVEAKAEPRL
ncbi:hypothetical protein [Streptomyces heilongjiangensis]|uniref:ATP synthase subunit b n=1 Tax=Streptomyces heilongjiangensis TaxID=945052 RepID=A0ABW1BG33_9ACTN|nr:hypothetical protein [Streptomyces heilongjiangensis]MDC2949562.1 hypothetical protein [Streptomyces heilongjiangensis]